MANQHTNPFTPARKRELVELLRQGVPVMPALGRAGVSAAAVCAHRDRDGAFDIAYSAAKREGRARRRGLNGNGPNSEESGP